MHFSTKYIPYTIWYLTLWINSFGYFGTFWIHVDTFGYKVFLLTSLSFSTSLVSFPMSMPSIQTPFGLWTVIAPSTVIQWVQLGFLPTPHPSGLFLKSYTTAYVFLSLTIACQRAHNWWLSLWIQTLSWNLLFIYLYRWALLWWELFTLGLFLQLSKDAL